MKHRTLLLLRVSLGLLMLIWGVDKLVDVEHGLGVAERFYLGVGAEAGILAALGVLEMLLGVFVILGLMRRIAYSALVVVCGITALGVWRSIVDPWGWWLEGTNVLFYPSLIILAGALVLWAFVDHDRISLDARRGAGKAGGSGHA